jgi:hypothetical protein
LASLCFSMIGYHAFFHFQIATAKTEMRALLKTQKRHADVTEFSFNKKEFVELEWENAHEFRYHNEMYDVIEQKEIDGKLIIRCISDKKETALLNEYKKTNKRNQSNSPAVQLMTVQFVLPGDEPMAVPQRLLQHCFTDHSYNLYDSYSSIVIPPPEVG